MGDDEQRAVAGDDAAVGEPQLVGGPRDAAVGVHPEQGGRARRFAAHEVEAEVADVGVAVGGHDHVVGVPGAQLRQVGVLDQRPVRFLAQHPAILHRHHEHAPVGQPAEAGRLLVDHGDLLDRPTISGDCVHRVRVEVHEVQAPVMPARSLEIGESLGHHRDRPRRRHVRVDPSSRLCGRVATVGHRTVTDLSEFATPRM